MSETTENKIVVFHASAGSGHKTAAFAIEEALRSVIKDKKFQMAHKIKIPKDVKVEVLDVFDFCKFYIDGNQTVSMFTGATRPFYDLTWRFTLTGRLLWGGGSIPSRLFFKKFNDYIDENKPLAVIATHICAANVALGAKMIKKQTFPLINVPTDYASEGLWPNLLSDLVCVGTNEMAEALKPRMIPESKIKVTGIPVSSKFKRRYSKKKILEKYNLPEGKRLVLALCGAHLPAPYRHLRQSILNSIPYLDKIDDFHLVIIAGNDEEFIAEVNKAINICQTPSVTATGFVDNLAELMSVCELVLCKPGGLIVSECLSQNIPMLLVGRAYGQENVNARMLTSTGAAMQVTTWREMVNKIRFLLEDKNRLKGLKNNSSYIRKPNAAIDIAKHTFDLIEKYEKEPPSPVQQRLLHFYIGSAPTHKR